MSHGAPDRIMIVLSIIERGKRKKFIEMMNAHDLRFHLESVGHGTAPSEMMDILGLGTNDKDIVISFAPEKTVAALMTGFTKNFAKNSRYGGLMMIIKVSAVNRVAAEIMIRSQTRSTESEDNRIMSGEYKYNLVLIAVNQGYADDVMQTAKKAGAAGGTVIRARSADSDILEQFTGEGVQEEKEIITILAPEGTYTKIMNEVNKEFGLRTDAKGVVCAIPVERALKI